VPKPVGRAHDLQVIEATPVHEDKVGDHRPISGCTRNLLQGAPFKVPPDSAYTAVLSVNLDPTIAVWSTSAAP